MTSVVYWSLGLRQRGTVEIGEAQLSKHFDTVYMWTIVGFSLNPTADI